MVQKYSSTAPKGAQVPSADRVPGTDPVAVVDQSFCFPFVLVFFPICGEQFPGWWQVSK